MSCPGVPSLRLESVDCTIGNHRVLTGIDLQIPAGSTLAVVGPNGCGKSTLLRTLSGLARPARGHVWLDDVDLYSLRPRWRAHRVAVVAQDEPPAADQTIGEAVALGLVSHRNPWSPPSANDRHEVLEALERVGIADLADRPCSQVSGGERRRALLARGLVQRAPVLVLDEPTNHLDIHQQLALLDLVRGLGHTVVAAMHDLDLAAAYFDRVALLHSGGLAAHVTPDLLPGHVEQAFGVRPTRVAHPDTGADHLLLDHPDHPRVTRRLQARSSTGWET